MKTKIHAVVMLVAIATAAPVTGMNMTNTHANVKSLLSNGPHTPPINAPQNGGAPGPTCLPGGTNCQ